MLILERSSNRENTLSQRSWESIEVFGEECLGAYEAHVREVGEVVGEKYQAHMGRARELEADLQEYVGSDDAEVYVENRQSDFWDSNIIVYNLRDKKGVQRGIRHVEGEEPDVEHNPFDEFFWKHFGSKLMGEILQPGYAPELAQLARDKGPKLVDVESLTAHVWTEKDGPREAVADLGAMTVEHLRRTLEIYYEVAYPHSDLWVYETRLTHAAEYLEQLRKGEYLGLRSGTAKVGAAKHSFDPTRGANQVSTCLYLNYDIDIGPIRWMHFDDDKKQVTEFAKEAQAYFASEGIAVKHDAKED